MRARRALALAALLALGLGGCTKVGEGTTGGNAMSDTSHPNVLSISTAEDPKNLNPALATSQAVGTLSAFLYQYAVLYDDHARPVPDAVSEVPTIANGDVSKDGLTLIYKIRPGDKWSDGVPVTCSDFRFTWQVMINPRNNVNTTEGWRDIKDLDCRNPAVAVVHMKRVYAPFLQQLWGVNGNGPIMPEHVLAKYNDAKGSFNTASYNSGPQVTSGPYTFLSWERGNAIRMQANPNFVFGKPKIDEVVYKIIPDQNTLATQVQTHEVDVAWNLQPASMGFLGRAAGVKVATPVVYVFDHVDFNLRHPPFNDVLVRRALTYAIDRKSLLDKVRLGLGELSNTFLDPTLFPKMQDPKVMTYPYDPAKAKALLDQDGWHVGPGGIRVKNGKRLSFQISTQVESDQGKRVQAQLQAYWRAVGADAEVKNYPTPMFFDNTANGIIQGGKSDVVLFAWTAAADIDNSAIYSGDDFAPHGQNGLFWNNRRATDAMNAANQTVDEPKRIALYHIVQEEFAKDDPSIILWFRKDAEAYTSALKGFQPTPVITTPFWDVWNLHY
ncbi:MAG TPA: peptide ABC transporter substrate-binding protein [Candidatus Sulfotelmatobacter sp.]|nr:peptide ABC transporter substrate-binding protein [Candidatus Sulfotelmatobacter sp.]